MSREELIVRLNSLSDDARHRGADQTKEILDSAVAIIRRDEEAMREAVQEIRSGHIRLDGDHVEVVIPTAAISKLTEALK